MTTKSPAESIRTSVFLSGRSTIEADVEHGTLDIGTFPAATVVWIETAHNAAQLMAAAYDLYRVLSEREALQAASGASEAVPA